MDLAGKNVLVTGAAKRLGREIALALATKGANIAIHYNKSKKEANQLVQEIIELGLKSIAVSGDIEKPIHIRKIIKKTIDKFGSIDILINNAAIFYSIKIDDITDKDWDKFLNINMKSHFYFAREFSATKNSNLRKIINISDVYGESPAIDYIPYGVSKGGVITLTKALAKAYAPDILVNAICPGPILSPIDGNIMSQNKATNSTLLKKEGSVQDITKTVVFLAENDYITGQSLFVDGGKSLNV